MHPSTLQLDNIDPGDKRLDEQSPIKHRAQYLKPAVTGHHSSIETETACL